MQDMFRARQILKKPRRYFPSKRKEQLVRAQRLWNYNLDMVVVSLRDFVDEMQPFSDEHHAYLNKITGELITITNEDIAVVESGDDYSDSPEWQQKVYQNTGEVLSSEDYLKLPDKIEIHEYEILERFCLSVPNEKISNVLLDMIRGSGAFRRFKELIYRYDLEKDWYKFRDEAYKEIAIAWLESKCLACCYEQKIAKQLIKPHRR
jgi:hypothetical protein